MKYKFLGGFFLFLFLAGCSASTAERRPKTCGSSYLEFHRACPFKYTKDECNAFYPLVRTETCESLTNEIARAEAFANQLVGIKGDSLVFWTHMYSVARQTGSRELEKKVECLHLRSFELDQMKDKLGCPSPLKTSPN